MSERFRDLVYPTGNSMRPDLWSSSVHDTRADKPRFTSSEGACRARRAACETEAPSLRAAKNRPSFSGVRVVRLTESTPRRTREPRPHSADSLRGSCLGFLFALRACQTNATRMQGRQAPHHTTQYAAVPRRRLECAPLLPPFDVGGSPKRWAPAESYSPGALGSGPIKALRAWPFRDSRSLWRAR
jgi:hypothetical protein